MDYIEEKTTHERTYYIVQKTLGAIVFVVGLLCPYVLNGDATPSIMLVPIGLYALLTREKILN